MPIIEKYDQEEFSQSSIEENRGRVLYNHQYHHNDHDNIENCYGDDAEEDDECVHRSALKAKRGTIGNFYGNDQQKSAKKKKGGYKNDREEFEAIEQKINSDNNNNRAKKVR